MFKWLPVALIVAVGLVIGCGGDGAADWDDNFTAGGTGTTATTAGGTTGSAVARYAGSYEGSATGSNTAGARFAGDGYAVVDAEGGMALAMETFVSGIVYPRQFQGALDGAGNFWGWTNSGERADGRFSLSGGRLTGEISWVKLTADGRPFYTETVFFDLQRR
jgi:hypothetical protein